MRRIFLWGVDLNQPTITVADDRLQRRLRDVLRLVSGDEVVFLNDRAEEGRFALVDPKRATFKRIELHERTLLPQRRVTLAVAMPKRDALETLIQRAVELGAVAIQPLITDRSNLKLTENPARWQALIAEALEVTSWRETPALREPRQLEAFLDQLVEPCYVLEQGGVSFQSTVAPSVLTVCVGPEGGWSETEQAAFTACGSTAISLGAATLRTETAALLALALLNFS